MGTRLSRDTARRSRDVSEACVDGVADANGPVYSFPSVGMAECSEYVGNAAVGQHDWRVAAALEQSGGDARAESDCAQDPASPRAPRARRPRGLARSATTRPAARRPPTPPANAHPAPGERCLRSPLARRRARPRGVAGYVIAGFSPRSHSSNRALDMVEPDALQLHKALLARPDRRRARARLVR